MNALVMYDHQTDTLWSQFLSRGVEGPLDGQKLEIVPSIQTTWDQWQRLHPDTLVLDKLGGYLDDYYEDYYQGGRAGILGEANEDRRLPGKELVVAIDLEGSAKAYPFHVMAAERVLNDAFRGEAVVVTFEPISETGGVFRSQVDGRSLTFHTLPDSGDGIMLMQDQQTSSTWQAVTGRAIDGPLAGKALQRLPSHYSFWFAWSAFHPDTELFMAKP